MIRRTQSRNATTAAPPVAAARPVSAMQSAALLPVKTAAQAAPPVHRLRTLQTLADNAPIQRSKKGLTRLLPQPPAQHKGDYLMLSGVDHGMAYHIRIDYTESDKAPRFHVTWENNTFGRRAHFYYGSAGYPNESGAIYTQQNALYNADASGGGLPSFDTLKGYANAIALSFVGNQLRAALENQARLEKKLEDSMAERDAIREGKDTLRIRLQHKPRKGWTPPEYYTKRETMDLVLNKIGNAGWLRAVSKETDSDVVLRFKSAEDAGFAIATLEEESAFRSAIIREASGTEWPFKKPSESDIFESGAFAEFMATF